MAVRNSASLPLTHAAELAHVARLHVRIGVYARTPGETLALPLSRARYPLADEADGLARSGIAEIAVANGGHLDVQIDAVEERSRDLGQVALHEGRGQVQARCGSPWWPHGQGFIAAASMNRAG